MKTITEELYEVLSEMLADQGTLKPPIRNAAICEKAEAVIARYESGNKDLGGGQRVAESAVRTTIVIPKVDPVMLEDERKRLHSALLVLHGQTSRSSLCSTEIESLEGISNMLDAWSDTVFYKRPPKLYVAMVDTSHFTFVALGDSEASAKAAMMRGWEAHCKTHEADPEHIQHDDIAVVALALGECLRDGDSISIP